MSNAPVPANAEGMPLANHEASPFERMHALADAWMSATPEERERIIAATQQPVSPEDIMNTEAMPALSRRLFLRGVAAAAPLAAIPAAMIPSAATAEPEPQASVLSLVPHEAGADAEIFRLARSYRAAKRAEKKAFAAFNVAEERYRAVKWSRPEEPRPSAEENASFLTLTMKDLREERYSPAWLAYEERRKAWRDDLDEALKANKEAEREAGVEAAELELSRIWGSLCNIAKKLLRVRARTLDGMLVKIRIQTTHDYDQPLFERELAKDLRALRRSGALVASRT